MTVIRPTDEEVRAYGGAAGDLVDALGRPLHEESMTTATNAGAWSSASGADILADLRVAMESIAKLSDAPEPVDPVAFFGRTTALLDDETPAVPGHFFDVEARPPQPMILPSIIYGSLMDWTDRLAARTERGRATATQDARAFFGWTRRKWKRARRYHNARRLRWYWSWPEEVRHCLDRGNRPPVSSRASRDDARRMANLPPLDDSDE